MEHGAEMKQRGGLDEVHALEGLGIYAERSAGYRVTQSTSVRISNKKSVIALKALIRKR